MVLLGVLIVASMLFTPSAGKQKPQVSPVPTPVAETATPAPKAELLKYESKNLGISFSYLAKQVYNSPVFVKEVGNKIYVYVSSTPEDDGNYSIGQYVEVFSKDKAMSLEEAVKAKFLTGSYSNYCQVDSDIILFSGNKIPAAYETAVINLKNKKLIKDPTELNEQLKKCPLPYTQSNGVSYFLGDSKHPDKFLFFSIGQYGIMADTDKQTGWQDTIEFL